MKILAIDTSTKYLSVAVNEDCETLAGVEIRDELKHLDLLIPTIDKTLKKCYLNLKDVDAIALSIGPGSFTGLRIGVATCKGINMALGIPIVAVPTLDVIAYNFLKEDDVLAPFIDAKKEKVYTSLYEKSQGNLHRVSDYMLLGIEEFMKKIKRPTTVFGDAVKLYEVNLKENQFISISTKDWHPKAEVVGKLGFERAIKKDFANPDKLVPMYLHSKYCQIKGYK